jgi:hypothetical protein
MPPVKKYFDLERVGELPVREDVHEQRRLRPHPAGDAVQQGFVVAHVLEHLDRDHAVEASLGRKFEHVGVAGDNVDIAQAACCGARVDEFLLRARIRNGSDARSGKVRRHPQRERTPAAAEFEDLFAIAQPGTFAGEAKHRGLGVAEARHAVAVIA